MPICRAEKRMPRGNVAECDDGLDQSRLTATISLASASGGRLMSRPRDDKLAKLFRSKLGKA